MVVFCRRPSINCPFRMKCSSGHINGITVHMINLDGRQIHDARVIIFATINKSNIIKPVCPVVGCKREPIITRFVANIRIANSSEGMSTITNLVIGYSSILVAGAVGAGVNIRIAS